MDKIGRKRDRLEIIYDILRIISQNHNSIRPTPLLRYSNLSSKSFNEYYEELIRKDLIREVLDKKGRKYLTLTDKGFRLIEKYKLVHGFIEEFNL